MQLLPLVGFYWRRNQQIQKLFASGATSDSHMLLDVVTTNLPLLKRYFPHLNEEGLLDDAVQTLKEVLAPPPT